MGAAQQEQASVDAQSEDVTNEEYASFSKSLSNDWEDISSVKHFSVEGQLEFRALLFFLVATLSTCSSRRRSARNQVVIRRVFIIYDCEELMLE